MPWAVLACAAWIPLGSASAAPQEGSDYAKAPDTTESFRIMQERRRDLAHPSDPMKLMGAFEEGNDLTANRGALRRSDFQPVFVDAGEAYERQLAMLDGRTSFAGWPNRPSQVEASAEVVAPKPAAEPSEPSEPEPSSSGLSWLAAFAVAALGIAGLVLQGRRGL